MRHIAKVLVYVTRGERLLVFRDPERPEQGIQVPGGSVEPGEALENAALREAFEETGLGDLRLVRYLGSAEYELRVDVGPPHLRHFFHLVCEGSAPERWEHVERHRFDLWWQPIEGARLDWAQDAYLDAIRS